MYSSLGQYSDTLYFGPVAKRVIWALVRCLDDKFFSHLALVLSEAGETGSVVVFAVVDVEVRILESWCLVWAATINCIHVPNNIAAIATSAFWASGFVPQSVERSWCSIIYMCLASLIEFMRAWHSLKVTLSETLTSWFIHVSLFILFNSMVLLKDLTDSLNNCLSAFW